MTVIRNILPSKKLYRIWIKRQITHRLENLEDNLEKNDGLVLTSCGAPVGEGVPPYHPLCLFWPLWNVDRLGTFLGNGCRLLTAGDTGGPRQTPTLLKLRKKN